MQKQIQMLLGLKNCDKMNRFKKYVLKSHAFLAEQTVVQSAVIQSAVHDIWL